ncbi:Peptidoglycan/xylan/chitin deacetylase, PgdA/CDA1 family [Natronincola peptidivorans]|uniref:Peptidoglycan/xylan/chitin deacetylase, PgdA/CDA1 family n=1 Tax=Natronincola peptidivorans TaxID=426128 RepID=A0A1I0G218_9FIRM|nr:polysaccharide deacetylase family protein [Natronincola peptidivorans]SET64726.1 Peptidoglycan/xylan/chitin deacetylase, PgdA/CDA1 family [Natronincola peptidivorans]
MYLRIRCRLMLVLFIIIAFIVIMDPVLAEEIEAAEKIKAGVEVVEGVQDIEDVGVVEIAEDVEVIEINEFLDVYSLNTNPYYESIYKVANAGIMTGVSQELFAPYKSVTRGELAVILAKLLDLKEVENIPLHLEDVDENHWSYSSIVLVLEEGVMKTKSPHEFKLQENATRAEVLEALWGLNQVNEEASEVEVTRGEMAYFIDLWFQEIKKEPLSMPVVIDLYDEEALATKSFIYSLLGKYSPSRQPVTIKILADLLIEDIEVTYDNYLYYRYEINDTSNINMLKLYSEGILLADAHGHLFPSKVLTRQEAVEIISRLSNPVIPERPEYIERNPIPILMYHEINTLPKEGPTGLYVSQNSFLQQLDVLKERGYNTITMDQLYSHWAHHVPIPPKPVVLTFDDGYASHYHFVSVELGKRGMTGTFYIITSMIDVDHLRTSNRLREMYEEGMEIGSHTVTHLDARYSSKANIVKEYKESKEALEDIIGSEIKHFCYPIGGVTPYARQTLKDLGYKTAVRTTYGKADRLQGMYDLRRIRIDYYDSIRGFLNKIK